MSLFLLTLLVTLVSFLMENLQFAEHHSYCSVSQSCFLKMCDQQPIRVTTDRTTTYNVETDSIQFTIMTNTLFWPISMCPGTHIARNKQPLGCNQSVIAVASKMCALKPFIDSAYFSAFGLFTLMKIPVVD